MRLVLLLLLVACNAGFESGSSAGLSIVLVSATDPTVVLRLTLKRGLPQLRLEWTCAAVVPRVCVTSRLELR